MSNDRQRLKFSIMIAPAYPWPELLAQARMVEAMGFDALWLPDHFVVPTPDSAEIDWFECWTLLSALAVRTQGIRLGTLVSSMTLRNPALLAKQAMTVDHVSSGRLELGVGAAGATRCHQMTGVPNWPAGERSRRYREWVEILDHMLEHEVTNYEGEYYQVEDARMRPGPVQKPHPPLSIAAHGPKALRLAAEYGDGWNSYYPGPDLSPKESSKITGQRNQQISEFAEELGRDPDAIARTFEFGWTSDKPFASRDALVDAIGRYHEAGIREFVFMYAPGIQALEGQAVITSEALVTLAQETIPALRRQLAR